MPFLKLIRNLICCFSDYDQIVQNCILGFSICEKFIIARNGISFNRFDCIYNVT